MSSAAAQLTLTFMLLAFALVFALIGLSELAVGLVGAVLGQGASVGIRAANGKP